MTAIKGQVLLAGLILATAAAARPAPPTSRSEASRSLAQVPAWFEANTGQYAPSVKYFSHHGAGSLLVGDSGATFRTGRESLRLVFAGGRRPAALEGVEPTGSRGSYMIGNDPRRWRRGIPHFAKVRARGIYPGVDAVYYLSGSQLEFDLVVAPGADPGRIRLEFQGAGNARLDPAGNLEFPNGMRQDRPVAFQQTPSGRFAVEAQYRLAGNGIVGLELGPYDASRPLVIDPVLHSGYLGGSTTESAQAIAVDPQGNVWITGSSASTIDLPADQTPPIQDKPAGKRDVFLARLKPDAAGRLNLVYWTQIGGTADDEATSIALDNAGFVYLAGSTASGDFPGRGATLQSAFGGGVDAFVAMIRPSDSGGDALWYSQFYGGSDTDVATCVAVDSAGSIYFAGYTLSTNLPMSDFTPTQPGGRGGYEGFVVKVLPTSSSKPLAFATYFGGGKTDVITGIAVSAPDQVYFTGYTASDDFPFTNDGFQTQLASSVDSFLVRLDLRIPGLDSLRYGTYLGGDGVDLARAMRLDGTGGLWIAGYTDSRNFPVTPDAYRTANSGRADIFLTRLDLAKLTSPNAITYSTYVGGPGDDVLYGMALAPGGRVALTGYTAGVGGVKAFLSLLDPSKPGDAALVYTMQFGGTLIDAATGVAADAAGKLFVSGITTSFDFPVTDGSRKSAPGGATQSFIVEVAPE